MHSRLPKTVPSIRIMVNLPPLTLKSILIYMVLHPRSVVLNLAYTFRLLGELHKHLDSVSKSIWRRGAGREWDPGSDHFLSFPQ